MKRKSEVPEIFKYFIIDIHTQPESGIKLLHSDNGAEGHSLQMVIIGLQNKIIQSYIPPYTPQLNAIFVRFNLTIAEKFNQYCSSTIIQQASGMSVLALLITEYITAHWISAHHWRNCSQ